jgi:hypothetical protein
MLVITVLTRNSGSSAQDEQTFIVAPLALRFYSCRSAGAARRASGGKEVFYLTAYPALIPQRAGRASGTG